MVISIASLITDIFSHLPGRCKFDKEIVIVSIFLLTVESSFQNLFNIVYYSELPF